MKNATRRLRIMVADDDDEIRAYYARILPSLGHDAISFESNGFDLKMHALEFKPDLIITDVRMPGINGLKVVEEIGDQIPCVIVTAADQPKSWTPPAAVKVVAYLVKPIAKEELKHAIEKATDMMGWDCRD